MRYCPNCGNQLAEETRFCPTCGTEQQNGQKPIQRNTGTRKRLHCPNCRSTNLTPVIESTSTIGSVGRISKNIALTETNVNNKSFWMCQECGHKFRNLEDLIQENERTYKMGKIYFRVIYGMLAVFGCFMCLITDQMGTLILIVGIMGVAWYVSEKWALKKMMEKKKREEKSLRKACFE